MRVALETLGCRLNEAELETWAQQFRLRGYQLTSDSERADLLVINTCAVTQEAVKKSRQLIRRCRRHNPGAKLVVSGCYSSLHPEVLREIDGIDLLVHNRDKARLVERVHTELAPEAMPMDAREPEAHPLFQRGRNRAFIKVQDGCRYQCSFCIVTVARGAERSKPVAEVIAEINALHQQGINEVILTGVHIGGYGSDLGSSLVELIDQVLVHTDIPRVRLGSLEPWELDDGFLQLFDNPRFMPHLHLPMQSGSDTVLRRMARRCKTGAFRRLLDEAKGRVADLNVTTDIIVGFPGESAAEWQQTLEFVEGCGFSHIHIFPYSVRSGTRAAGLSDQVGAAEKKRRCRQLHLLGEGLKREFMQGFVGREMEVLLEDDRQECGGQVVYSGYTANYLKVVIPAGYCEHQVNRIIPVRLDGYLVTEQRLSGVPVQATVVGSVSDRSDVAVSAALS
ncbi:MAG: tRNA (N(6)-L-threonylcarbamoyladenosine(37)-C(2))-methylthiotransferase MtaB [Gammaproteobacteria bacterium]